MDRRLHTGIKLCTIAASMYLLALMSRMRANNTATDTQEDTRSRLVKAAIDTFGRVGYTRATTRMISEAAELNEVTLFRHFGSKKNLLMACVEEFNAHGFTATFESQLTGNYAEDIFRMAYLQVEDTVKNLEMLRLLLSDARNVPELRQVIEVGEHGNTARLSRYFQQQIDNGAIRPELPAHLLASTFDSLFSSNVIAQNLFYDHASPWLPGDNEIRTLVDLFVRGTQAVDERAL